MIDILAALHQVDYRAVGLEDFGRIGGYMTADGQLGAAVRGE